MSTPTPSDLTGRRRILVADEDPKIVDFLVQTLREDGFAVFHAYDALSATEPAFALTDVHLVVTNTRVSGVPGIALIYQLRSRLPDLPILYIANIDRSTRPSRPNSPVTCRFYGSRSRTRICGQP